jgi:hypothetical protein
LVRRKITTGSHRISDQNRRKSLLAQPANDPPEVTPLLAENWVWSVGSSGSTGCSASGWVFSGLLPDSAPVSLPLSISVSSLSLSISQFLSVVLPLSQSLLSTLDLSLSRLSLCLSGSRRRKKKKRTRKKTRKERKEEKIIKEKTTCCASCGIFFFFFQLIN